MWDSERRKLSLSDAGTCRCKAPRAVVASLLVWRSFDRSWASVANPGCRGGAGVEKRRLESWNPSRCCRTSVIGMWPGTPGTLEVDVTTTAGRCGTNRGAIRGWARRKRRDWRLSREARTGVGNPPARTLESSVSQVARERRPENGMSQRVHLKTSRLQRRGDEVSLRAGSQCIMRGGRTVR